MLYCGICVQLYTESVPPAYIADVNGILFKNITTSDQLTFWNQANFAGRFAVNSIDMETGDEVHANGCTITANLEGGPEVLPGVAVTVVNGTLRCIEHAA